MFKAFLLRFNKFSTKMNRPEIWLWNTDIFRLCAFGIILTFGASAVNGQDLQSGVAELRAGYPRNALNIFLLLAEQGDVEAMARIAVMYEDYIPFLYEDGTGVPEGMMPDNAQALRACRLQLHPYPSARK